jgi:uncharacterized protein YkwD
MARRRLIPLLAALALVALAPAGASAAARTPCAAETAAPTAANLAQVSDAVYCLTNQIRTSYGLPAFRRDARLDAAARLHSEDMAARKYFAHATPEGRSPGDRAAAQGYPGGVGENIAYGYANARAVVLGWMASAGHCRNILGEGRDIGVGSANPAQPYYTQDFGNYDFGSGGAAAAGCPYKVDLSTLVVSDSPAPAPAAGPLAALPGPLPAVVATAAGPAAAVATDALPALGRLGLDSARLRPGARGRVSLTLSAPATVTFGFERRSGGRYRMLRGSFAAEGREGANRFTFRARLNGRALAAGRYRLRAVATDDAGNASAPRRIGLRVIS